MPDQTTIETTDGTMELLRADPPDGRPRGGVVVIQEAFGLTPHIGRVCDRLAADRWLAVAPALFHRTGSPVLGYGDRDQIAPHFAALDPDGLRTDLDAALAVLGDAGIAPASRGVVGFCMGGSVALWAATTFELGASVTYYGGGLSQPRFGFPPLLEVAGDLRCPWQGHFGDLDQGIPIDDVEALRDTVGTAPVEAEVHRYPEAGHGFNCDDRDAFHRPSAELAWSRTLDWFGRHLAGERSALT
jgi:carboxymethylenebutenolidase